VDVNEIIEGAVDPSRDAKGRMSPELMSDREIAIETLYSIRAFLDILEGLGNHPMARSLGMVFPTTER
jgi:hypothetical protein